MGYDFVPHEIRMQIADHILDWSDHKAFRQADSSLYRLLTNRKSVRAQFKLVETGWAREAVDRCMLSVTSGQGVFAFLSGEIRGVGWRHALSPSKPVPLLPTRAHRLGDQAQAERSELFSGDETALDAWNAFVHRNDSFAILRRMLAPDAVLLGFPYKLSRTQTELYQAGLKDFYRRYWEYARSYGENREWLALARDISVTCNEKATQYVFAKLKDTMGPSFKYSAFYNALHYYHSIELYWALLWLGELNWMKGPEEIEAIRRRADDVLLELEMVVKLWLYFNNSS
ncbi:hypothetical protein BJ508DRAFT_336077 [Ascobolus immersus RN42]|uniref:Uncharacterized protein n=1 Tax=Ascobolus immersus RN42 TaxID=1160509 RepID=A0A3N4HH50_ASCIM|nr:hypothetical protein BJ508DRAFT_336077 [Ascobolus immersus RN42]